MLYKKSKTQTEKLDHDVQSWHFLSYYVSNSTHCRSAKWPFCGREIGSRAHVESWIFFFNLWGLSTLKMVFARSVTTVILTLLVAYGCLLVNLLSNDSWENIFPRVNEILRSKLLDGRDATYFYETPKY